MALQVKDPATSAAKWSQRASAAAPDYTKGVQNPKKDYATNAAMAEPAYDAGVQAAIGRKAFSNGVRKAGTQKWQAAATSKGAQRYPQGVALAQPAYQAGWGPYSDTMKSLTIPARGPKGAAQNYQIVQAIGDALHAKKIALSTGS